jgi:hypothetical protein
VTEYFGNIAKQYGAIFFNDDASDIGHTGIFGSNIYKIFIVAIHNLTGIGLVHAAVVEQAAYLTHGYTVGLTRFFVKPYLY